MSGATDEKQDKSLFGQWKEMQKDNFALKPAEKAHVIGMGRQGLAELRGAVYADSNIAQPTDYGIWGKSTPGETADQRNGPSVKDFNEEHAVEVGPVGRQSILERTNEIQPPQTAQEARSVYGESRLQQRMLELESRPEPDREDKEQER